MKNFINMGNAWSWNQLGDGLPTWAPFFFCNDCFVRDS